MELTKITMPTPNDDPLLLDHHSSSSTRRKKRQFIAVLILCFTLILAAIISVLAVLKHHIESESPAKNPALAIRSVCSLSGYMDANCHLILSPLRTSSETNPAQIFTLAVRSAIDAISELTPLPESTDPKTNSTLRSCEIAFNETLSQLTSASTTLGVDPGAGVGNLTAWLSTESFKVNSCLDWLEWPTETGIQSFRTARKSTRYASSSLTILSSANMISETFNPTIKSTLASFLAGWNNAFTVCVFGAQYLYLVVLVCILLRLY